MILTEPSTVPTRAPLSVASPAKVNLTLRVLRRRDDGYHEIRSIVMMVELCDTLRCRPIGGASPELVCNVPELCGEANLACRAVGVLARRVGRAPAVRIEIDKVIPIGGGLGGGSSNAAAALTACNELWNAKLDHRQLAEVGLELGSDVPLFFSPPSAMVSGRGDRVTPARLNWAGWVLLIFPAFGASTTDVYRAWRPGDSPDDNVDHDRAVLEATGADEMNAALQNDLVPALFRVSPRVADLYESLDRAGVGPLAISGSGSTLFRVFDTQEDAVHTADMVDRLALDVRHAVVSAPFPPRST